VSDDVKRYFCGYDSYSGEAWMPEASDGEYVKYTDYAALAAERDAARADVERIKADLCNAVLRANSAADLFDTMRNALRKVHDFTGRTLNGVAPKEKP